MGFPGTWMTESESMVYRVVPKCACSSIGQIMYYSDHGEYFDGDIHDAKDKLHKWALDKICGIQRNGKRYRGNLVPLLIQKYGIEVGDPGNGFEFDQIKSFRRFLLFARDTIRWRRPMDPDIHWSAMSGHISTFIVNGGRYDNIFFTEHFNAGMKSVLDAVDTPVAVDIKAVPRFNESEGHGPKRLHPIEDYFDDLSMHLVYEIYKRDFNLFKYDPQDPGNKMPIGEIDLDEVHAKLGD